MFQVLYDLHYPPVNKNMINNMLDICEVRENILISKNISLKNISGRDDQQRPCETLSTLSLQHAS